MRSLPKNSAALIYILLLAEELLFTHARNKFGLYGSPVVLLTCSVTVCVLAYNYLRHRTWPTLLPVGPQRYHYRAIALAGVLGLALTVPKWYKVIRETPIAIKTSDIIPSVAIYVQRLLAGKTIYTPFDAELGYPLFPTYLPATWGPYLVPQLLGFDYRWMTALLLLAGIAMYAVVLARLRFSRLRTFALALLPFLLVRAVLRTDSGIVSNTIEMMIVGYYFVLVGGILLPGRTWRIIGLLLCLLSRFSLVLWVPLYLGLLWFRHSKREALLTTGWVALGVLALYVVPFLSHDWLLLAKAQQTYTTAALGEWQHFNDEGLPYHLYNGIGLTNFFYRFAPGDLLARLTLVKQVQAVLLVVLTGALALVYWRQRAPRLDYRLFAVISLKLYFAVFCAFVQVPYAYLALVGISFSVWLALLVSGARPASTLSAPAART
jgi:hypothetical protein